jgi:hypothetical protein
METFWQDLRYSLRTLFMQREKRELLRLRSSGIPYGKLNFMEVLENNRGTTGTMHKCVVTVWDSNQ